MLGKLMKYEWKATWKLLLPMDAFIVLISILVFIMVQLSFFDSDNALVVMTGTVIILTYVLSMIVIAVGTIIYLIYRFYTSVYGDEGYLLHTLPVDKHHIIIAKAVTSAAWVIINSIVIFLSLLFVFSAEMEFLEMMESAFEVYVDIVNDYHEVGGFGMFMLIIAMLFATLARILKIFASVSLGQLASNHKVLASFGFYYGIYFIQNLFEMFFFVIVAMVDRMTDYDYSLTFLGASWEITLITSLIYCALFYFLTWYVMDKKLNLD